jgi:hypothetical protein
MLSDILDVKVLKACSSLNPQDHRVSERVSSVRGSAIISSLKNLYHHLEDKAQMTHLWMLSGCCKTPNVNREAKHPQIESGKLLKISRASPVGLYPWQGPT